MAQIIRAYSASPEFNKLAEGVRADRRRYLARIEERLGWMAAEDLNAKRATGEFYALRDEWQHKPPTADAMMATLATMLAWAERRDMVDLNRAARIERLADPADRADMIWTEEDQARFLDGCRDDLIAPFKIALWTGIRLGDLTRLTWDNYDGQWLVFRPSKTAKRLPRLRVHIPVFLYPPLAELLGGLERVKGGPILQTRRLRAWTPRSLQAAEQRRRDEAGIDLHWHDLRGTCITRLAEAGCTDAEVASISGHRLGGGSMLGDYTARTRQLAAGAYRKLWTHETGAHNVVSMSIGNRR